MTSRSPTTVESVFALLSLLAAAAFFYAMFTNEGVRNGVSKGVLCVEAGKCDWADAGTR